MFKSKILKAAALSLVVLGVGLSLSACGKSNSSSSKSESKTITIGSQGTDTVVWQHIAKTKQAKDAGLNIKVENMTDSGSLNRALVQNEIQANAFQSYAFYATYNKENSNDKVYALGTTYIQPMGLYSSKYKSLSKLPKNSTLAIANDPAAESRGLKLLESAGLIKLKKHNVDDLETPKDIESNPKHFVIKTVVSTMTPSLLKDNGIAAVAIDNNTAQAAHLNVFKDALYHEQLDQNTRSNVNVIATNKQHKDDPTYKKLVTLYHNKDIQAWIKKNFPGKVEIKRSVDSLAD